MQSVNWQWSNQTLLLFTFSAVAGDGWLRRCLLAGGCRRVSVEHETTGNGERTREIREAIQQLLGKWIWLRFCITRVSNKEPNYLAILNHTKHIVSIISMSCLQCICGFIKNQLYLFEKKGFRIFVVTVISGCLVSVAYHRLLVFDPFLCPCVLQHC